jgi:hypothetical protein
LGRDGVIPSRLFSVAATPRGSSVEIRVGGGRRSVIIEQNQTVVAKCGRNRPFEAQRLF